ncbi:PqqD family peptide modification chaperone [Clostridium sp. FAM 1755]|uniref:PqqD family peptide modification chaperone n=1 Tax=Clostridium TaxID=1485 RepID=UPI0013D2A9C4|nr:PqqD family peptide modification chaperone [Clostridium sporogenes]EJP6471270.1 PqqD family peptide modification chaperone [Clostridium botulinum]NFV12039.1 PqqD family peptide modification chaperone [Clostridium sporogenes]
MDSKDDKYNFLKQIPYRVNYNWVEKEGQVILTFKVNDPVKKFLGWLVKREPKCDVKFDKMSSEAWILMDGENSILDIAKIMSDKHGDKLEDSIYRLVTYIRYVSKRGWITFKNKNIFISKNLR